MKHKVVEVKSDHAYIIPIGDLHLGDKAFSKESRRKLEGYIDWVRERDNAFIFLNGDLLNTATRGSKSTPFEQDMTLEEQISGVADLFLPVKDKILGAICGNHERRVLDYAGYDPTISVLTMMGLPVQEYYFKYTAIIDFKLGTKKRYGLDKTKISYTLVFHHTIGGGGTPGAKLNRAVKMAESTISNGDVYCGSHNHALIITAEPSPEYDPQNKITTIRKQTFVCCGGYLGWDDSYAEAGQLRPTKIGSPRIRLDGTKKDVHVEI